MMFCMYKAIFKLHMGELTELMLDRQCFFFFFFFFLWKILCNGLNGLISGRGIRSISQIATMKFRRRENFPVKQRWFRPQMSGKCMISITLFAYLAV